MTLQESKESHGFNRGSMSKLDKYDIGAVYYDWSEKAVYNLKKLITNCDAKIVQESYLSDEYAKYAERILKYGAWWEDEYADLIKHEQLVEHEIKKVIFLDIDGVLNDE